MNVLSLLKDLSSADAQTMLQQMVASVQQAAADITYIRGEFDAAKLGFGQLGQYAKSRFDALDAKLDRLADEVAQLQRHAGVSPAHAPPKLEPLQLSAPDPSHLNGGGGHE